VSQTADRVKGITGSKEKEGPLAAAQRAVAKPRGSQRSSHEEETKRSAHALLLNNPIMEGMTGTLECWALQREVGGYNSRAGDKSRWSELMEEGPVDSRGKEHEGFRG